MHFYCQCLNVTIDVLEKVDDQAALSHSFPPDLSNLINAPVDWVSFTVPSEQTVHVAWQCLYQSWAVRDMKLHRCLACQQYTHVSSMESNRVLINRDLLDDTTMKTVYLDPNYSEVTKIVLPTTVNNLSMIRTSGSQDEILHRERELVQQKYRQSLEDAERESEEKIRIFQQEQEQLLASKTARLDKELNTFLSFIRSVPRFPSNTKLSPTSQSSNSYINENSMESGFGSDIFEGSGTDFSRQSSTVERTLSDRASFPDDDDTNEDSVLDNSGWPTSQSNVFNFATSLPKDISFRPKSSYAIPQQDDDSDDLERIGKSFRELSQSLMCTDGTELFGELPSPRLNARHT